MKKENAKSRGPYSLMVIALLTLALLLTLGVATSIGSSNVALSEVVDTLTGNGTVRNNVIILSIRFPRNLVAMMVGMSLALSGAILQGVMKNPLASPNIIGVSSGAGLGAIGIMVLLPHATYLITPVAFVGALSAALFIYVISWQGGISPIRVILSGVAVSSLLSAGINSLLIFYPDQVAGVVDFMVGGLSAISWKQVHLVWPYLLGGSVLAMLTSNHLNIMQLGDEVAITLGLNIERSRFILIAIAALLAASSVSVVGLLGFVGLMVPHIARLIVGSDYRYLLPTSSLMGGILLLLCDTIARTAFRPIEIPVGIIMSLLGAPFFIYLLRHGVKGKLKG